MPSYISIYVFELEGSFQSVSKTRGNAWYHLTSRHRCLVSIPSLPFLPCPISPTNVLQRLLPPSKPAWRAVTTVANGKLTSKRLCLRGLNCRVHRNREARSSIDTSFAFFGYRKWNARILPSKSNALKPSDAWEKVVWIDDGTNGMGQGSWLKARNPRIDVSRWSGHGKRKLGYGHRTLFRGNQTTDMDDPTSSDLYARAQILARSSEDGNQFWNVAIQSAAWYDG